MTGDQVTEGCYAVVWRYVAVPFVWCFLWYDALVAYELLVQIRGGWEEGRIFSCQILRKTCHDPDLPFFQLQLGFLNGCNTAEIENQTLHF